MNLKGKGISIKTKYVISAAGPWVDELRTVNNSKKGKRLHLTKGVHLVFPKEKLPVKQSVYFDIPDGRMMFAIPRGKVTYGTLLGAQIADDGQWRFPVIDSVPKKFETCLLEFEDDIIDFQAY